MHRRQGVHKPGAVRNPFIEGNTPCHQTQEEYEMLYELARQDIA